MNMKPTIWSGIDGAVWTVDVSGAPSGWHRLAEFAGPDAESDADHLAIAVYGLLRDLGLDAKLDGEVTDRLRGSILAREMAAVLDRLSGDREVSQNDRREP